MLEGLRVVELAHLIAGPYCGQLFADNGATVIKVEPPHGEISRHRDPVAIRSEGSVTAHFASTNRGKKSITVDLKSPDGREFFLSLVDSADVVLSNMRPGALDRLGIGLASLVERKPDLIAVSITGFGVEDTINNERERAGLAVVAEAISGITNLTKDRNGAPVWCGFPLGDMIAGHTAYSSVLAAVLERQRTGRGRFIDLALADTILPLTAIAMAREQLADEQLTASAAHNDFHGVPYGVFKAADGFVSIGANTNAFWLGVCRAMQRPDLAADPEFSTFEKRSARFDEVMELVEAWTSGLSRDEIVRLLGEQDIPVSPVHNIAEVLKSERYAKRSMLVEVDDGVGGSLTLPADPALRGAASRVGPVPRLGQHSNEIALEILGTRDAVDAATARGTFGPTESAPSQA